MKRILVTGFSGFVGRHFLAYSRAEHPDWQLLGLDLSAPVFLDPAEEAAFFHSCDLLDPEAVREQVLAFRPDAILHLAALSSVAYSWAHPGECFGSNLRMLVNLTEAARELESPCRILTVGSSEEYGAVSEAFLPVTEDCPLSPANPYAAAKVSGEMLSRLLVERFGMDIVMTRSFNHIGPGQDSRFAVSAFLERIRKVAENGQKDGEITVGDLSVVRDFSDVRDVVRAYGMLLEEGVSGEIYNICSGTGYALSELIPMLADFCGVRIRCVPDPELMRPAENPKIIGSHEKITKQLGWKPEILMQQTLLDMIAFSG